ILSPADAIFDGQVLYRLHVQIDAGHLLNLRTQPPDHVACRYITSLFERLQGDLDAAAVHRGVYAVGSDERRQTVDSGILTDSLNQLLLQARHGRKRDRLGGLRDSQNGSGVLNREESLRYDDVEVDRESHRAGRD